jgi:hypothetical protein
MRYGIIVSLVALIAAPGTSALQDNPENAILRRAAAAVRKVEPEWRFATSLLNLPPPPDQQLGVAEGTWYKSLTDPSTSVTVRVERISTAEAAAGFLDRQPHGGMGKGWTVTS